VNCRGRLFEQISQMEPYMNADSAFRQSDRPADPIPLRMWRMADEALRSKT